MIQNTKQICDKVTYNTQREAAKDIVSLSKKDKKHKFGTYTCKECGRIHIHTINKKILHHKSDKKEKYPIRVEDYARQKESPITPTSTHKK